MRWSERRTAVRSHSRRLPFFHPERRAPSSAVAHLVLVRRHRHSHEIPRRTSLRGLAWRCCTDFGRLLPVVDHDVPFVCAREYCRERAFAVSRRFSDRARKFAGNHRALASITPDRVQFEDHFNRLTRRCSEPRTVLMPRIESMRTSFVIRAVADLVSR